jgi:hypothetical protein
VPERRSQTLRTTAPYSCRRRAPDRLFDERDELLGWARAALAAGASGSREEKTGGTKAKLCVKAVSPLPSPERRPIAQDFARRICGYEVEAKEFMPLTGETHSH